MDGYLTTGSVNIFWHQIFYLAQNEFFFTATKSLLFPFSSHKNMASVIILIFSIRYLIKSSYSHYRQQTLNKECEPDKLEN